MATGTYGTIRPADVSPTDIEIILNYTPSRDNTSNFVLTKLDSQALLTPYFNNNNTGGNTVEILGGLYNLNFLQNNSINLVYILYLSDPHK